MKDSGEVNISTEGVNDSAEDEVVRILNVLQQLVSISQTLALHNLVAEKELKDRLESLEKKLDKNNT